MNILIISIIIWTILGYVFGLIILVTASIFIIDANNGECGIKSEILYKTTVLFGGPGMWIFARWVEKQSLVEDL